MKSLRNLLLTAVAVVILPSAASAGTITIAFDSPSLLVHVGDTVVFRGTVTNNEAFTVDLNQGVVFLPGAFTIDDGFVPSMFFYTAPFTLDAGQTSDPFDMFSVTVDGAYAGPYGLQPVGTFTIVGGIEFPAGVTPDSNLGQAEFQVDVLSPEPGTFVLLGLAFPAVWALRRRRA